MPTTIAVGLAIIPTVLTTVAPNPTIALASIAAMIFFLSFPTALGPTILQSVTPNEYRATVIALYLVIANLVGLIVGPTSVAMISDYFLGGAIGQATATISAIAMPVAASMLIFAKVRFFPLNARTLEQAVLD